MAEPSHPSFVPKQMDPSQARRKERVRQRALRTVVIVSATIFLLSGAAAVGAYLYNVYVHESLESTKQELAAAQEAFDEEDATTLINFDRRLRVADRLLDNHIVVSSFFDELESLTLESVQFSEFTYSLEESTARVQMRGVTDTYEAIALQSDIFGESRYFLNPIFSDFTESEESSEISFSLTFDVDPRLLGFNQENQ